MRTLFPAIEEALSGSDYQLLSTRDINAMSKVVRDLCDERDAPVSRSWIQFILKGYKLSGAAIKISNDSSSASLIESFRDNVMTLAERAGIDLTPREREAVADWLQPVDTPLEDSLGSQHVDIDEFDEDPDATGDPGD